MASPTDARRSLATDGGRFFAALTGALMDSWHSYPSTFQLGHKAIADLLRDPVLVEEKIDGSQFSFGRFGGELYCRSKGAQLHVLAPEQMFKAAVDVAGGLDLHDGWTYRSEYLVKPKHNALVYDRVPDKHLILFDVNTAQETYLAYDAKAAEAARIGLEVVPRLYEGMVTEITTFRGFLERVSCLGGQRIEGVVIKNYARFGADKKVLIGKFVSEAFKEVHAAEWKQANPNSGDVLDLLIATYRTPARWQKALQHLTEAGQIEGSPRDIGLLFKEVPEDVRKEAEEEIKAQLFAWAWARIRRGITAGLAEWYKEELLKRQFNDPSGSATVASP